ncbi:MAG TPA: substrate-binding domain-containing protein [Herpetosiphonaceae bacterium]
MAKAPTIHDIARAANVSPSTVSRVLNGGTPVTPQKRAAVLAAITALNFKPNPVARGLARGKSMAIGVLTQSMASLYYGELAQGIDQGLHGGLYHPVYATGQWRVDDELAALHLLLERQVDGLIVLGGGLPDETLRSIADQVPLIVVGRVIAGLEAHSLSVENHAGAYRATRYLVELGHHRIAHITGILSHIDALERREGYCQALRDSGLEVDEQLIVEGAFTEQSGLLAAEALLGRSARLTAVFAANDQMAYGARLAFYRRGLRVPEDISLIGFDDLLSSAYATPPLTTVRQHMVDLGRAAAEGMLRLLDGQPPSLPQFPTDLIVRESAARCR